MRALCIIMLFTLAGCLEDKEAILAECRLKYDKDAASQEGVMLCMSAKGYEFASAWEDDKFTTLNGKCWYGTMANGKPIPTQPAYILSDCYNKRSAWNLITH